MSPQEPPQPLEGLQFQKAEFDDPALGPRCQACKNQVGESHFRLAEQILCPACAEMWKQGTAKPSAAAFSRAALFGIGAAIAGAILMAVIAYVTKMQFALVAIAVGYLVGKAVRMGAGGLGGRRCQVLAVILTWLGITMSYVPEISRSLQGKASQQATAAEAGEQSDTGKSLTLVGWTIVILLALVSPFFILAEGFSGIINALIIVFGLTQAWRLTGVNRRQLVGPIASNPGPPAVPA